jgi:predicted  nucleic acid-binding Zn-ribbon protein
MASKVVVRSVDELNSYCRRLAALKIELETNAKKLVTLSEELKTEASAMSSATEAQGSNWQDPQYEKLKGQITPCVTAVNATSTSVKETAATIKTQMTQVQGSIEYIQKLIKKLNEIS